MNSARFFEDPRLTPWVLSILGLCCSLALAADTTPVAFVGVWDRSMPMVDAACRANGLSAAFFSTGEFAKKSPADAAKFPFVFVLNLDSAEVGALTHTLKFARENNPKQRVLALDKRSSQIDLEKASLLTPDDKIIAYWRPNGPLNIPRLMTYCVVTYLGATGDIEPPILIPDQGYYDLGTETAFDTVDKLRLYKQTQNRWKEGAPNAVLIIQQSFWITHDLKVVDAQIAALERAGMNAIVVFGDREANVIDLVKAAKPTVLIEDRHGSMWQSNAILKELDAPYLRPISMLGYTNEEWAKDPRGLSVRDVGMFMSLQESWGTIEPVVVGGLKANIQGFRLHEPIPDRVEKFAQRAARWATLRNKPNAEKKLALIYYNKSLGQDDLMRGSPTGAFMDGPESLIRFLPKLKEKGFSLDHLPKSASDLIETIKKSGRNIGPWAQGDLEKQADQGNVLIPLSQYKRWFNEKLSEANRKAVTEKFGPPPGKIMVVTRNGEPQIVLPRIDLGNVTLMPQPERGEKQDEKLLHSRDVPPPHNYLAFYWWLEEQFKADAIVHWGTHGSLELLPGKESGLSKDCWSDICVGNLIVLNLWIMDNMGEATLSRRRSYAELIDHMVPPAVGAGLKDEYKTLHDDIHKFRTLDTGLLREEFRKSITELAKAEKFTAIAKPDDETKPFSDDSIARLDDHLHNLYESIQPLRLHILGEPPIAADELPYLVSILGDSFLEHLSKSNPMLSLMRAKGGEKATMREEGVRFLEGVLKGQPDERFKMSPELSKDVEFAKEMQGKLRQANREVEGLLHGLDGRYVEAGPGPEPIRNPSSIPAGRNLYSMNPEEIPNKAAWEVAKKLVDDLLKIKKPQKIAMDLNGMETMRDFGVMEGQILYLLGVRPIWNRNNLVVDVELIPAEELKRPRVDVFIAMGGMYKENFTSRVTLLDKAVRLAASAKESTNPVRDGVASVQERLLKRGFSSVRASQFASARIFGTKTGNMSGTNILYLVPRSGVWDKDDEVTSVYMDNMSYVYTEGVWGEKVDGLYEEALQGTDTILRVWASNMTSQLSNHHAYEYLGGLNMAVKKVTGKSPQAYIADVRDPSGGKIRNFEEVLATNLRTELLNKNWINGMKKHDYAGAGHMAEMVKNTFGWSVTRPEGVPQDTWDEIYDVYVKDKYQLGLNEWFERVSPHAMQELTATMLEASRKGKWNATPEQLNLLSRIYAQSIAQHGDSGGLVSGGNTRLNDYATRSLTAPGQAADTKLAADMKAVLEKSAAGSEQNKVAGQKLESVDKDGKKSEKEPSKEEASAAPVASFFNWQIVAFVAVGLLLVIGFFRKSGSA